MLRRIRWIGGIGLGVLVAILVALAVTLSSSDRTLAALTAGTRLLTPYALDLQGARIQLQPFEFRADLLRLQAADAPPTTPPLLTAQELSLDTSLAQLVRGRSGAGQFRARNITYFFDEQEDDTEVNLEALLAPLGWLPDRADIGSLHLISRAQNVWIFPLLNLTAQRTPDGSLAFITEAEVGERRVVLEALVDWLLAPGGGHWIDLKAAIFGPNDDSELVLEGRAETLDADLAYSLSLAGTYTRVSDFLAAFDPEAFAFPGNLSVDGRLEGNLSRYELDLRELRIADGDAFSFVAEGSVRQNTDEDATLDLFAHGSARDLEDLLPLPTEVEDALQDSEVILQLAGPLTEPVLTELGIMLVGPGDTRIRLSNPDLALPLRSLEALDSLEGEALTFTASATDVPVLLQSLGYEEDATLLPRSFEVAGILRANDGEFLLEAETLNAESPDYTLRGEGVLAWRDAAVSLSDFDLSLEPGGAGGRLSATGSVSSLADFQGAVIDISLEGFSPQRMPLGFPEYPGLDALRVDGELRLLRLGQRLRLQDLRLLAVPGTGMSLRAEGTAMLQGERPEADLSLKLEATQDAYKALGVPLGPEAAEGRFRLRPTYATFIADVHRASSKLQAVVNAELEEQKLSALAIDLYSPELQLEDFVPASPGPTDRPGTTEPEEEVSLPDRIRTLPDWPLRLSLRSGRLISEHTELYDLSVAVRGDAQKYLLEHLDARYAGGELMFRGVLDRTNPALPVSLAGQGIAVPLADLTQDLGLQQSVTGALSVRAGLSTTVSEPAAWMQNMNGNLSLAARDTTISGAAYDLLMSNLLAWLVQGNREKTTTFDCTMARFDFADGVARSDSLLMETPRMLASGTGQIDFTDNAASFRIEPRSKTRSFQFPSSIRVRGPLDDLSVDVSELQATADLSAQALLLLPSLTLKLFGLGPESGSSRLCKPSQA